MTPAELGPPGPPSPRRTLLVDSAIAVFLAVFLTAGTYFALEHQPGSLGFDAGAAALVVAASGALAFRRRYPAAVLLAVTGLVLAYRLIGYGNGPIWITLVIAFPTTVMLGHRLVAGIVALAGVVVFPWLDAVLDRGPGPSWIAVAALAAWLIVLFGIGEGIRVRRDRAAEAARVAREEGLRRASEERLRIARELHDALGHQLSLISVQAGVALHVNQELPDQARSSLQAIKVASKDALTELRSVLDILRQDGERAPRSPTSTLRRLDDLVEQARAAGLDVRTEVEGESRVVPFGVDVAAFRIVQEALTNVTRHAGSATATVHLAYGEHDLVVEVDDDGRGRSAGPSAGSGQGIVGMRERAAALGGELEAGPRPAGGFRIRARLPLDGSS
jgi:signal transduction histidine kinase